MCLFVVGSWYQIVRLLFVVFWLCFCCLLCGGVCLCSSLMVLYSALLHFLFLLLLFLLASGCIIVHVVDLGALLFLLFVLVFCLDCVLLRWSCCLFFVVPCVVVCLFCGCCRAFFCVLSLFGGVLSACWFSSSLVSLCFC